MRVLHVTGEVAPYSKTGGLGEVLGALPAAQRAEGVDARVLTPLYGFIKRTGLSPAGNVEVRLGRHDFNARFWKSTDGFVTFVDIPGLLDRPVPYGEFGDNPLRFGAFCRVAAALAPAFDVTHLHDWPAALTAVYLRGARPTVQTIHNLAYQGLCGFHWADVLDIPPALRRWDGLEFHGHLSLLKAGLVRATRLTTVSPRYAREILTEPGGQQLSGLLQHRASVLTGILNGIDTQAWDPATDPALPHAFSAAHPEARAQNRADLLTEVGLSETPGPVFGVVARATWQKGLDLLAQVLPSSHLWNTRFVIMADGDHDLLERLSALAAAHPQRIVLRTRFDEALSRRIYAGADFIVVPSRFEPCGLTQMFAMRYGAVPVVRETGGLADTVRDGETGLTFFEPTAEALQHALERALSVFEQPEAFDRLRAGALATDGSWTGPARAYAALYSDIAAAFTPRPA